MSRGRSVLPRVTRLCRPRSALAVVPGYTLQGRGDALQGCRYARERAVDHLAPGDRAVEVEHCVIPPSSLVDTEGHGHGRRGPGTGGATEVVALAAPALQPRIDHHHLDLEHLGAGAVRAQLLQAPNDRRRADGFGLA